MMDNERDGELEQRKGETTNQLHVQNANSDKTQLTPLHIQHLSSDCSGSCDWVGDVYCSQSCPGEAQGQDGRESREHCGGIAG